MGIKNFWAFVKDKGYSPEEIPNPPTTLPDPASKVRLDFGSVFRPNTDTKNAPAIFLQRIQQLHPIENIVVYIDGERCKEKAQTHSKREEVRCSALAKAENCLAEFEERLNSNKRVRKSLLWRINKNLKRGFHWTLDDRYYFHQYLVANNVETVFCSTEADVQIAADCQPYDIVVSSDSDMMIYSTVRILWRSARIKGHRRWVVYNKEDVLKTLQLSDIQLLSLGILSGNDYNNNINGLAIFNNYKLVKAIAQTGNGCGMNSCCCRLLRMYHAWL